MNKMRVDAIGFVEVVGLVAAIEAGDAMVKAAKVRLLREHRISPGWETVVVEGDLAACQAAVQAGRAAAMRLGKVIGSLVIPRPDVDTEGLVLDLLNSAEGGGPIAPAASSQVASPPVAAAAPESEDTPALEAIFSFVALSAHGRTCQDVVRHFHFSTAAARERLDRLLKAGRLKKTGNRYAVPPRTE
jgi:ethanolamine utilization protein EutK